MASILGGELVRRLDGRADSAQALAWAACPKNHASVSISARVFREGLINEYVEPARICAKGKLTTIRGAH